MGISDVIHETLIDLIDGAINYYEEDEYLDLADNEDVLEVAAVHLKVDNRRSYCRPSEEDLARIEAVDWKEAARKFIVDYLMENYMPDEPEESEDEKVKPYICTVGVVKK